MKFFAVIRHWWRMVKQAVLHVASLPRRMDLTGLAIRIFAFPQHSWAKRLRRNLASDSETVQWQQVINPLYWIVWGARFGWKWMTTRPYMALGPAIPAMLVLVILGATAVAIARRDTSRTQTIYLDKLRSAMAAGETEVAAVAAQRLLELDPDNLEHQYQLAILDDELGRTESARRAVFRLAIQKQYGPAALWMLKAIVYEDSEVDENAETPIRRTSWGDGEKELCHQCASIAINNLPTSRSRFAQKLYAGFLSSAGFDGAALRQYEAIAEYDPSVNLAAALLADRAKEYEMAQLFAKSAIRYLKPRFLSSPTNVQLRLQYAQALVLDEQFNDAYRLLVDGYRLTPAPILKIATGESLIFKAKNFQRELGDLESMPTRAELIFEARRIAPESPLVMESVVEFLIECAEVEDEGLRNIRRDLLKGLDPASKHFVEGTVLMIEGEQEKALHHLELAAQHSDDRLVGMLNNLAFTLGHADEKYLPRALELSDMALEQLPRNARFHDTRGQILLRMKRYQDAILDLEQALSAEDLRPVVHASLADAYEALGIEDMASEHRQLARRYGYRAPSP